MFRSVGASFGPSVRGRAVTTPIAVPGILAMAQAIPDPRWRFAFQLLSAKALTPWPTPGPLSSISCAGSVREAAGGP